MAFKLWNVNFEFGNKNLDCSLKEKINEAKSENKLPNYVNVLTGIDELTVSNEYKELSVTCSPAFFPLNTKEVTPCILRELYDDNLFKKPLLSVIVHAITEDLSYVILQQRNNKTSQGHSQFQPSAAGYVDSAEIPSQSAIREFNEEVSGLIGGLDSKLIPKALGITTHYIAGNKLLPNSLLGYVMLVGKDQAMKKLRVAKNLNELDNLSVMHDSEVSKLALVPYESFENLWNEVVEAERNFGDVDEGVGKSVKQFIEYVDKAKI